MKAKMMSAVVMGSLAFGCTEKSTPKTEVTPVVAEVKVEPKNFDVVPGEPVMEQKPSIDALIGIEHKDRGEVDHLAKAEELRGLGEKQAALDEARKAVFDHPGDDESLNVVAKLAELTRKRDLAILANQRLGEVLPDDPIPLIREGRVHLSMKALDAATQAAKEAIARDEGNAEGHQLMGRIGLETNELELAIRSFEKAIELAPDHGYAMNNLGLAYLRANENMKAVEVLEKAVELLPEVAYVQNNLGVAYQRIGDVDAARASFERATELSPRYVKAKVNAARLASIQTLADETVDNDEPSAPETPAE